ncbi:hypothetical protein [Longimicrobium terrae]|uniref:Uncharacterized protein n=1 Tax=Longimicrobium terrae TaxID=1639882 RepID=A0A841H5X0_9BACT|nr:hypothetical protein [Longimicrobium terrae]MBB4639136.1 hypothetical protein [Longimicrobium terrae]MBB6073460.1 hypothetical protein [Longimicrobium terrae]NNC32552.1 hypothetical protein [Longimicrobium terrae]
MATRKRAPEPGYEPEDLVPGVPTLYIALRNSVWELRRDGVLLSTHPTRVNAIDVARAHSDREFCNILAEGSTGRLVFQMSQDPKWLAIARELDRARGFWPR